MRIQNAVACLVIATVTVLIANAQSNGQTSVPGAFDVRFDFGSDVTAAEQAELQSSLDAVEQFYETAILGFQPGVQLDGIDISILVEDIDQGGTPQDGNVLARARPGPADGVPVTVSRQGTFASNFLFVTNEEMTSLVGQIEVDQFDLSTALIVDVLKHETAHALGYVPGLFDANNLLDADGDFIGDEGLAAFQVEFGDLDATSVPLDDISAHLDEDVTLVDAFGRNFSDELLTPIIEPGTNANNPELNFFSNTSAGIFRDLGFVAFAPSPSAVPEPSSLALLALGGTVILNRRRRRR